MRALSVSLLVVGAVVGLLWALQRQLVYFPDDAAVAAGRRGHPRRP